jgi:hypothetical protein
MKTLIFNFLNPFISYMMWRVQLSDSQFNYTTIHLHSRRAALSIWLAIQKIVFGFGFRFILKKKTQTTDQENT